MTSRSILQDNIAILKVYMPNNRESNYVRQKIIESQREIDESTIMVGNFNTTLLEIDRSIQQRIGTDTVEFNNNINQLDITDFIQHQNTHFS